MPHRRALIMAGGPGGGGGGARLTLFPVQGLMLAADMKCVRGVDTMDINCPECSY